jgi:hypothetical protein
VLPPETLIPTGYRTLADGRKGPARWRTQAQLDQWEPWAKLHPEMRRRCLWVFAQTVENGRCRVGIGGGWRSETQQEAEFFRRTREVACPGQYQYLGKCYDLLPGMAPIGTPGGGSYHPTSIDGFGAAIDAIEISDDGVTFDGKLARWLDLAPKAGLNDFSDVNNEPWHGQFAEVPNSRRRYQPASHPIRVWPLPDTPPVVLPPFDPVNGMYSLWPIVPKPVARLGSAGDHVRYLQARLRDTWFYGARIDGQFGPVTDRAVRAFQKARGLKADGVVGPVTWPVIDKR